MRAPLPTSMAASGRSLRAALLLSFLFVSASAWSFPATRVKSKAPTLLSKQPVRDALAAKLEREQRAVAATQAKLRALDATLVPQHTSPALPFKCQNFT